MSLRGDGKREIVRNNGNRSVRRRESTRKLQRGSPLEACKLAMIYEHRLNRRSLISLRRPDPRLSPSSLRKFRRAETPLAQN